MKKIYIYTLSKNDQVYYVGRSATPKRRMYHHKALGRFDYDTCEMTIIDECDESNKKFWEQHYISLYKSWGFNLINKEAGHNADNVKNYWLGKSRIVKNFNEKGVSKPWTEARRLAEKNKRKN